MDYSIYECFFREEYQDMGSHVPFCSLYHILDYTPCKDCPFHISSDNAKKLVIDFVRSRVSVKEDSHES